MEYDDIVDEVKTIIITNSNIDFNVKHLLYFNIIYLFYFIYFRFIHVMMIYLVTMHGKRCIFTVTGELFNTECNTRGRG